MKKLTLNKKTITNLNNEDLNSVIGGRTAESCVENLCVSDNNGCGGYTSPGGGAVSYALCKTLSKWGTSVQWGCNGN